MNLECPHEGLGGVFENFLEPPGKTAITATLDRDAHSIAMHDAHHFARREEHGFLAPFDAHEAEAGTVGAHHTLGGLVERGGGRLRRRMPARCMISAAIALTLFAVATFQE